MPEAPLPGLFEEPKQGRQPSNLRLLSLRLVNFMGLKQFVLDLPDGCNVSVFGDNAVGKTTLFTAFTWLLFGKDSQNRTDFEVKTLDENNQPLHGLEHEVEALFSLGSRKMVLRKVYAEKWVKVRGSAERTFAGHTTDHFVDGVPVAKREYESRIAEIVDEKVFRLLSDPAYFNESLHWEERRRILLDICGDISDADVIASNNKLSDLQAILGDRSLDDHRKVIKARRADINKELEKIPVRINEAQRALPDVSAVKPDVLKADIAKMQAARQEKLEQITRVEQGGGVAEKQNEIAQVRAQMLEMETAARRKSEDALRQKRIQLQDAQIAVSGVEREINSLTSEAEAYTKRASRLAVGMEQLRNQWHDVDAQEFCCSGEGACPTCGQNLPEEMVQAAQDKALADFNLGKAQRLEVISAEGQMLKQQHNALEADAALCGNAASKAQARLPGLKTRVMDIQAEIGQAQAQQIDASQTVEYAKLATQRDALAQSIAELKAGSQSATTSLKAELATIEQGVRGLEKTQLQLDQHTQGQLRIAELQAQEKALAQEYERLEREMYLTEEFIRCKVRMLEDRINGRFRYARFRLFDVQVNGAISECCDTLYNGVPYGSNLNRGARTNVGLDIINALSGHYGFSTPIWLDNREAVTRLIPTTAQLISLVVSEPDKSLRVMSEAEANESEVRRAIRALREEEVS